MIIEIKRVKLNYIIMIVREEKIIQQVKSRVLYILYFIVMCGFTDTVVTQSFHFKKQKQDQKHKN